jgi:hypothetical protein
MPDEELDSVEWELVRADIALEKARLEANGDFAKWEAFQSQADARYRARASSLEKTARAAKLGQSETEENRIALWCALWARDLSFLMAPFRGPRSRG